MFRDVAGLAIEQKSSVKRKLGLVDWFIALRARSGNAKV